MSDDALQKHLKTATNIQRLKIAVPWLAAAALVFAAFGYLLDNMAVMTAGFLVSSVIACGVITCWVDQDHAGGEAVGIRAEQRRRAEAKRLAEDPDYARKRALEEKVRASVGLIEAYIESRVAEIDEDIAVSFPMRRGDQHLTVSKRKFKGHHVYYGRSWDSWCNTWMLGEDAERDEALVLAWPDVKRKIEQEISKQRSREEYREERIENFVV